jgi:type II secretory pathway pseudopilin PulG
MRRVNLGLTMVELLVAISFFGIVSVALFSFTMSSLQTRRNSQLDAQAQQYASGVLEAYKSLWSQSIPYSLASHPTASIKKILGNDYDSAFKSPEISTDRCFNVNRAAVPCAGNPSLRQVTVTIRDGQNKIRAQLSTEIGRPIQ